MRKKIEEKEIVVKVCFKYHPANTNLSEDELKQLAFDAVNANWERISDCVYEFNDNKEPFEKSIDDYCEFFPDVKMDNFTPIYR